MIKAEKIPDEVESAMEWMISRGEDWKSSLAAALSAWPDAEIYDSNYCGTFLKLPLTQEPRT
jgi:hypothetical protein